MIRRALVAMPHLNEPIGSMMLEYLSLRLAEDDTLRESLGYTWYLVKSTDPYGTRLNEGSFKIRGATNKLLSLTADEKRRGGITFFTGNHGRAAAVEAT